MESPRQSEREIRVYNKSSKSVYFLPILLLILFYTGSKTYEDRI